MTREPTLDELLEEPIIRMLMAKDGVTEREVRQIMSNIEHGLRDARPPADTANISVTTSLEHRIVNRGPSSERMRKQIAGTTALLPSVRPPVEWAPSQRLAAGSVEDNPDLSR